MVKLDDHKGESDLSVTSMITNIVGQRKVLLPSNHNCYNFRKQQIDLGQICAEETTSTLEIPQLSRISGCCYGYCDQFCDGWIWLKGLNMIGCFNCVITGVWLLPTVRLHCLIATLQNDLWKIKQLLHKSHLRKLQWVWLIEEQIISKEC